MFRTSIADLAHALLCRRELREQLLDEQTRLVKALAITRERLNENLEKITDAEAGLRLLQAAETGRTEAASPQPDPFVGRHQSAPMYQSPAHPEFRLDAQPRLTPEGRPRRYLDSGV